MTGPPSSRSRAVARASRIRAASAPPPLFSSRPPGITISDSARSRSTTSATKAGVWAAGSTMTNRSTFAGSEARSGTQRTPSIWSVPGFTTVIRSGSKPSWSTLARMTRPAFAPLETPTIAIDRGASRRATLFSGRGVDAGRGPSPRETRTSRATRPSAVTAAGLISHSSSSSGTSAASPRRRSTASTTLWRGTRGGCPRCGVVARRTAVVSERAVPSPARGASAGETMAISRPGRRSAESASVTIPPAPTLTTAP